MLSSGGPCGRRSAGDDAAARSGRAPPGGPPAGGGGGAQVDWDYHMRLVKTNPHASIIHFKHWREWRATGQAFEIRDSTFTEPNRTQLSTATGAQAI